VALKLLSYLAPSLPEGLFELVASELAARTGGPVTLDYETRVSGPTPEDDPFREGRADLAFVCAPSYPLLREAGSPVVLLPAAPVFGDPRTEGRPVYFSDVIVRADHTAARFEELAGAVWCYNDRRSRSGWQNMIARLADLGLAGPEAFFSSLVQSGAHVRSLEMVAAEEADAAAIDSNTLWLASRGNSSMRSRLRVLESWGPMPIQPVLAHASLGADLRSRIGAALLSLHEEDPIRSRLARFGVTRFAPVEEEAYARLEPLSTFRRTGRPAAQL
jgi:phosphonate transport system substrate-binding protein